MGLFDCRNTPYRIKAGETFAVRIDVPKVDCPCGTKWEELRMVTTTYEDQTTDRRVRCPLCKREGPREQTSALAMLAWGGMISREKSSQSALKEKCECPEGPKLPKVVGEGVSKCFRHFCRRCLRLAKQKGESGV